MSKIETVRAAMMQAMKEKDTGRKDALSMLLSALKAKEKDKRAPLTEAEEDAIVQKEIKQTKETMESAPQNRQNIKEECRVRLEVLSEFAPAAMGEEEIKNVLQGVLKELNIDTPAPAQKGVIMKALMPLVAGKADGQLVNRLVSELFV